MPKKLRRQIGDHRIEHGKARHRDAQAAVGCRLDQAVVAQRSDACRIERAAGKLGVARDIDAFGKPQPHEQKLVGDFLAGEHVVGDDTVAARLDPHEPGLRPFFGGDGVAGAGDIEPANVQATMGARSDAGIFVGAPIDEIVPAFAAGPRMIGDLVGRKAVRRADLLRRVVKRARGVLVGSFELAGRMQRGERRVQLDGQLIKRKMLAGLGKRALQLARPRLRRLLRPRVDEIERGAIENARAPRRRRRAPRAPNAGARARPARDRRAPARRATRGSRRLRGSRGSALIRRWSDWLRA